MNALLRASLCILATGLALLPALDAPPTVATPAAATPATVTTKTTKLTVVGADDGGTAALTYAWSATGPAAVGFSATGTNAARTVTATFSAPGDYTCAATITDGANQSVTSSVAVQVVSTLTSLAISPTTAIVNVGQAKTFTAVPKNQFGTLLVGEQLGWSATGAGTVDAAGIFTAGAAAGAATVTVTDGAKSASATIRVNAAPTVATPVATATTTIAGTTAVFAAAGADDMPIDELLYTWSATGPKGVAFAPRSSVTGESTTATFAAIGTYTVTVSISDKQGLATTSALTVNVVPVATSLSIAPSTGVVVNPGATKAFAATVRDQFKAVMSPQPAVAWSVTDGSGSIGGTGVFLAGFPGPATVTATSGVATGSVALRVNAAPTVASPVATDTPTIAGSTAVFSVQGADDDLADLLSYSWKATGPHSVTFAPRSGTTAESTTATFTGVGAYTVTCTITDKQGLSTTSSMAVTVAPVLTSYAIAPATAVLNPGAAKVFAIQAHDQFNAVITGAAIPSVTWSATGGSCDATGRFVAGAVPGAASITAVVATDPVTTLSGTIRVNATPTVAEAATATPNPTTSATVTLHALGADDGGPTNLYYTWSVLPGAPGTVTFSGATQNTTAAQTMQASLGASGTYNFSVLIRDAQGLRITSTVNVTYNGQTTPTITWAPPAAITWGTALGATQLNASAGAVPGSFTYTPPAGTILEVGTTTLTATFTPNDSQAYRTATASVSIQVVRVQPVLTWAAPASIDLGTALGATQLAATCPVAGSIAYAPAAGTVLAEGTQALQAVFTPTDVVHYTQALANVTIAVVDRRPPTTTYIYDNANRLIERRYHDGPKDTFAYDAAGRLTQAVSQRYGTTVSRAYDAAGRLTQESQTADGTTDSVGYGYDAANRTKRITYPDGSEVKRTYTDRNELQQVDFNGAAVAARTYDDGGRLTTTTYGNNLVENRTYVAGSSAVATIKVPGVTDFTYQYDRVWRKTQEQDAVTPANSQSFGYDDAGRLTAWQAGAATQSWNLSPVGDWSTTTRNGQVETRTHTKVHETTSVNGEALGYDARGNLIRDLPYADGTAAIYTWDAENRLATATASDLDGGATGTATYRYDALGRRVGKTVWNRTTTYVNAGAQVVQRRISPQVVSASAAADDGDLASANGRPPGADWLGGGGILAHAQRRVNFQPETSAIPSGFVADKGRVLATRTNGLLYGWDSAQATSVERHVFPLPQFDTFTQMQPPGQTAAGTWSFAVPNGTYAVVVVMGDATSRNQTNDIQVNDVVFTDPTPATTEIAYQKGDFDGYIENITVTDGFLRIVPRPSAFDPKLCFVEVGVEGTMATDSERARLTAVISAANNMTARSTPSLESIANFVYGSYIDEVVAFTNGTGQCYVHSNSLYSPAAITDSSGNVVERYSYDAYGKQGITSGLGALLARSSVNFDRGFTGYIKDDETGLYYARARMYSPWMGRFVNRDPAGYVDGASLYNGYFAPNHNDWSGTSWTVADFIAWFWLGGGKAVDLHDTGNFEEWHSMVGKRVRDEVAKSAAAAVSCSCSSETRIIHVGFIVSAPDNSRLGGFGAVGHVVGNNFAHVMGGSYVEGDVAIHTTPDCVEDCDGRLRPVKMTMDVTANLWIRDKFDNPLDVKNPLYDENQYKKGLSDCLSKCGRYDRSCQNHCKFVWPDPEMTPYLPFRGTPYGINADWTETMNGLTKTCSASK